MATTYRNTKVYQSQFSGNSCPDYIQMEVDKRVKRKLEIDAAKYRKFVSTNIKKRQEKKNCKDRAQERSFERDAKHAVQQGIFDSVSKTSDAATKLANTVNDTIPEVSRAAQAVNDTAATFQELGANCEQVAQDAKKMVNLASEVLTQIKTAFTPIEIVFFGHNIVPTLLKVAKVIANFAMAKTNCKVASLLMNASFEFGDKIVELIRNVLFTPRLVEREVAKEAELQGIGDVGGFLAFQSYLSEHRSITVTGVAVAIAAMVQFALGVPTQGMDVDKMVKFFGDRCRSLKSIVDFGKASWNVFTATAEWIIEQIFPGVLKHGLDEFLSGYDKWSREIQTLVDCENPFNERVKKEKALIFQVERLYKQGLVFSRSINLLKVKDDFRDHYQKHWKLICELQKLADYSGVLGNKPRAKPTMIHLFGESGVGKSGATWPLSSDLHASVSADYDEAKDTAAGVYFRNTEQEFWDGYAGQNVCVYDDFGQRTDSSAAPNEEFMELIRAGNIAPYPLHMAQLEEKNRTKFVSKFIVLTSNVLEMKVSSLTFPSAYRRRIDVCAKVTLKPEYTKEGFNADTNTITKRLDVTKCKSAVDTDPYLFLLYNPETQMPIGQILDYDQFLDVCLSVSSRNLDRSLEFNNSMENRISKDRFEILRRKAQLAEPSAPSEDEVKDAELQGIPTEQVDETLPKVYCDPSQEEVCTVREVSEDQPLFEPASDAQIQAMAKECRSLKLMKKTVEKFRSLASKWLNIKTILTSVGVFLSAFGIWKLFERYTKKTEPQPILIPEGFNSGDSKTKYAKVLTREITSSGDSNTKQRKVFACEGDGIREISCSGDFRTRQRMTMKTESNEDEEIPKGNLQAWKDKTAQELITYRILNNMYRIEIDGQDCLNGFFVQGRTMLTNLHAKDWILKGKLVRIWNMRGAIFEVPASSLKLRPITTRTGHVKDAMLIQFPALVNSHTTMIKHFQTMPELAKIRTEVCVPTIRRLDNVASFYVLGLLEARFTHRDFIFTDDKGVETIAKYRDLIEYKLATTNGDCGGPVIVNDTTHVRKIAGIHACAYTDGSMAFGQSVTQADLRRTLASFEQREIEVDYDELPNIDTPLCELQMNQPYSVEDFVKMHKMPAETFGLAGKCVRHTAFQGTTDLRKSVIHGLISEPTTKPARLWSNECNLIHKNMEKCAINTPHIPQRELKRAVAEVKPLLIGGESRSRLARLLTYEEAVSGSEDSVFIKGLNRHSSPGYPWCFDRQPGKPGKTTWFGDDEWVYDETVKIAVENRIKAAREGHRLPVVWTDTLKDERRPIEKVNANKTRVFAYGPMDYTVAVRMYFLGFVAHVMENRIKNEQSLGTNPMGPDWTVTAKHLSKFGEQVFAGDFSTFDGTLNSGILNEFADVVNEFYDDGPENALIRRVLMEDVFNSIHLCDGLYIQLTHSQPSGNPLTTVLNSFYNSVSMRVAYYRCAESVGKALSHSFGDNVSMVSYGDDNVINFSPRVQDFFNQIKVTEAYASFGMIYTDESKTEGEIAPWRNLSEVAYLKRGFRMHNARWYAPLDLAVIKESCNWVRKCDDQIQACKETCETAFRELAQFDEQTFAEQTELIKNTFFRETNVCPVLHTREYYLEDESYEFI